MLSFLTINMAAVTSRTSCLAVLFWSGRVRMSRVPPAPPLSEETPNPNPNFSHYLKLHSFYSISFNLSNVHEISGLNPKGRYLSLQKGKENFSCCVHLLHKAGA